MTAVDNGDMSKSLRRLTRSRISRILEQKAQQGTLAAQTFPERGIFARGVRGILVHVMLMRLRQRAATRHLRRSNEANMDITELYHFLFETPEGVGCLVGICLVLSLIVCVIMERRTRKRFADRPKGEDDWSIFDDDDEDEEKED